MDYGGWSDTGRCGLRECDGMPDSNVPGWRLGSDAHGCSIWKEPSASFGQRCGHAFPPPPDGGPKGDATDQ